MINAILAASHFLPVIYPRRNKLGVLFSIVLYLAPLVARGEFGVLLQAVGIVVVGGFCFALYPLGGWSHAVFHLVMALLPAIILEAALRLK